MQALWVVLSLLGTPAGADRPDAGPAPSTPWTAAVDPASVLPEYPRPQLVRSQWANLNGEWQFAAAKEGEEPPLGKELNGRILVPFALPAPLSGVTDLAERVWYRRSFAVPPEWLTQRVLLHFGAVDWEATVWLNGTKLGAHRGGYDGFSFDITDHLKPRGPQELVVGVVDPSDAGTQPRGKQVALPHGIWHSAITGIWRTVWLEPVPPASISALRLAPDVDARKLSVTVAGRGTGPGHSVTVTALAGGVEVATASGTVGQSVDIELEAPRLWSPADPFLYDLRVALRRDDKVVDAVESYFGMRKVSVGRDERGLTRLLLNDVPLFQYGLIDQGYWPDGIATAPTDAALRHDIELARELGFNAIRKHVKVEPRRWYYWCDRIGLLVWQDMPSGDKLIGRGKGELDRSAASAEQFETELKRMIESYRNHPSIIAWVLFNEGWGQFATTRLSERVRELDPTRLICAASGWNDMNCGDTISVHRFPGPSASTPEPHRAAVLGEFGGLEAPIVGHIWKGTLASPAPSEPASVPALDFNATYAQLVDRLRMLIAEPGLSAAFYYQLADVEAENSGLVTYDRRVVKVEREWMAAQNAPLYLPPPHIGVVVPTSHTEPQVWRYTLERPSENWMEDTFDVSDWRLAPAGFGREGANAGRVRTPWDGPDLWLRRAVELPEKLENLFLRLHHTGSAVAYLNGVEILRVGGESGRAIDYRLNPVSLRAVRSGQNTLAIHMTQGPTGQYFDAGLVTVDATPPPAPAPPEAAARAGSASREGEEPAAAQSE